MPSAVPTRSWRSRPDQACPPLQVRGLKLGNHCGRRASSEPADHHAMRGGDSKPAQDVGQIGDVDQNVDFRLGELIHLTSPVPPR